MLQRLAYVVREHRAMNAAMGDMGSPSPGPGADIMAIINGRQAPVGVSSPFGRRQRVDCGDTTLGSAGNGCPSDQLHRFQQVPGLLPQSLDSMNQWPICGWAVSTAWTADCSHHAARQQVPAVTSAAAAYIHPYVDLQAVVPPVTHPAAPHPLGPVLPLSMPQALPAPAAAAGRLADASARGVSGSICPCSWSLRGQSGSSLQCCTMPGAHWHRHLFCPSAS
jgi:hypothetical protein